MSSPYVNYPRGQQFFSRDVSLDSIGEAWNILTKNAGVFVLGSFIVLAIAYAVNFIVQLPFQAGMIAAQQAAKNDPGALGALYGAMLPSIFISSFVGIVVSQFLLAGLLKMSLAAVRGSTPQIADMFTVFGQAGNIILLSVLTSIVIVIGYMLCILPAFLAMGMLMFALPYVIDQNLGAVEAMQKSYETLKPYMWMATLVYFVTSIATGLGVLACCVGLFFTYGLLPLTIAVNYRNMTDTPAGAAPGPGYPPVPGMPEAPSGPEMPSGPEAPMG